MASVNERYATLVYANVIVPTSIVSEQSCRVVCGESKDVIYLMGHAINFVTGRKGIIVCECINDDDAELSKILRVES